MDYRDLSKENLDHQPAPAVDYDFRIFFAEEAFDRISSQPETTREVGGMLIGNVLRDDNGPFVRVDAVIEALHAEERDTELTLTHDTWNDIYSKMDTLYADKRIVGWYHTHPDFGVFLSERDQFIQQSFFNLPFQIAFVYDPVRRQHGVFAWRDGKPARLRQYWIGKSPHIWDGSPETPKRQASKPRPVAEPAESQLMQKAVPPPESPLGEVLTGGWFLPIVALVALAAFWLGGRLLAPSSTEERARGAEAAVASLNTDLLSVLRSSLGNESWWRDFDDGVKKLNQAIATAVPLQQRDPALQPIVLTMTEASGTLDKARQDRRLAYEMLRRLEQVATRSSAQANTQRTVEEELKGPRQAIGGLYAELARSAQQANDNDRARQLLINAAKADPEHKNAYQEQLKSFEPKAELYQDKSGKWAIRTGDQSPQPSPSTETVTPEKKATT